MHYNIHVSIITKSLFVVDQLTLVDCLRVRVTHGQAKCIDASTNTCTRHVPVYSVAMATQARLHGYSTITDCGFTALTAGCWSSSLSCFAVRISCYGRYIYVCD